MTEIVIAGSRQVDPFLVLDHLEAFLEKNRLGIAVRLRCGVATLPGPLEREVVETCEYLKIHYSWWIPDVRLHSGRKAVWYRDTDMVAGASLVLCYYLEDQIGDEESGTASLVDKAMGMDVPVYAYAQIDRKADNSVPVSHFVRVGEHDEFNMWGSLVPGAGILAR